MALQFYRRSAEPPKRCCVIGIDFGTANSRVAVYHEGEIHVIKNDDDKKYTPSCVAYSDSQVLVGEAADRHIFTSNIVWGIKRFVGLDEEKEPIVHYLWPIAAVTDDRRRINFGSAGASVLTAEIIAEIFRKLKRSAETFLRCAAITDAVVSVPACFNAAQRQIISDAATIAGLTVLRLLNEPTATVLAALNRLVVPHKILNKKQRILVVDCGAGTTGISLITVKTDFTTVKVKVKASYGCRSLGGYELDHALMQYFKDRFLKERYGIDLGDDPTAMRRLRAACENLKKMLSTNSKADTELDVKGSNVTIGITREQFESLCEPTFQRFSHLLGRITGYMHTAKTQVDEILLVGGSCYIPKLSNIVKQYFGDTPFIESAHAEEAIVRGAAFFASTSCGKLPLSLRNVQLKLIDILSYDVHSVPRGLRPLMEASVKLPFTQNFRSTRDYDGQSMEIRLVECSSNGVQSEIVKAVVHNPHLNAYGVADVIAQLKVDESGLLSLALGPGSAAKRQPDSNAYIKEADAVFKGFWARCGVAVVNNAEDAEKNEHGSMFWILENRGQTEGRKIVPVKTRGQPKIVLAVRLRPRTDKTKGFGKE